MASTVVLAAQLYRASVLFFLAAVFSSCYAAKQVYYQGNLLATRKRVDVLIWRGDTPEDLRQKLKSVKAMLAYAELSGLEVGGAYATYVESPNAAVSYIVQAAEPDQLKLLTWSFPVIGDVPYLGFYHRRDRNEKAAELRAKGYDVEEGAAGAFSSLGWYDDPLYSSMLKNDDAELAHLLFHELVHRTFWIADAAEFNENLAAFIGEKMTIDFLKQQNKHHELSKYEKDRADKAVLRDWLLEMKAELKALYQGPFKGQPERLLVEKARVFKKFTSFQFPKFAGNGYERLQSKSWNNASVLAMNVYAPDTARFEKSYRCSQALNPGKFLEKLHTIVKENSSSPLNGLDSLCK